MAEDKKIRLYKVAADLNIGKDDIIAHLAKVGLPAKNHMALLTDAQLEAISAQFKKDKEVADKHKKKVETFRAARTAAATTRKKEPAPAATPAAKPVRAPKPAPVVVEAPRPVPAEVAVEELAPAVAAPEIPLAPAPEAEVEEIAPTVETAVEEVVAEPAVEAPAVEVEAEAAPPAAQEQPAPPAKVPHAAVPRPTLPGLKIMGKVDLTTLGKTKEQAKAEEAKKKKKKIKEVAHKVSIKAVTKSEVAKPKKKRIKGYSISQEEIAGSIKRTYAQIGANAGPSRAVFKKQKRQKRQLAEERAAEVREREKSILRVTEFLTVAELANLMSVPVGQVISKCIGLGLMVSINQRIDKDTIVLIADDFGFQVEFSQEVQADVLADTPDDAATLRPRPPVVTVMGHVDHGKTSLLDFIRSANVVAGEAGGITQHIGAYSVTLDNGRRITFLDTPGHEAFTAMRARGARLTDIVVLVVAADDAVMPQTIEAISHAQAANVPIIVAINKCDKPEAAPDRIRQQLADHNVLVEEWGGKYQSLELSARTGKNVPQLLEKILLEADVLDLKANPDRAARGVVVEAQLDRGKGIVATVLVQKGTLRVGDAFVTGTTWGRVRALTNERRQRVEAAHVSTPIQVLGLDGMPQAGDEFVVVSSEAEARDVAQQRQTLRREQEFKQQQGAFSLDEFSRRVQEGGARTLAVIIKGDVDGSVEALNDAMLKLSTAEARVTVLHRGVGEISEGDVILAAASGAIIVGFHVRPNLKARKLAETEDVEIRFYTIIYECLNDIRQALEGLLAPEVREEVVGTAQVREVFRISRVGTVAGSYVQDGKIVRTNRVRLLRDGIAVFDGALASLKRFKDDVREVEAGFECGIAFEGFNDVKTGDTIESYARVEEKRKLE